MNVFTQNLTICYSPGGLSTVLRKQATLKGGSIFIFCPVLSCSVSTPFGGPLASPTNSRYNRAWKIYYRADKGNKGAAKFLGKSLTIVFWKEREIEDRRRGQHQFSCPENDLLFSFSLMLLSGFWHSLKEGCLLGSGGRTMTLPHTHAHRWFASRYLVGICTFCQSRCSAVKDWAWHNM